MQEGDPDVSQSRDLRRRMRWIHTRHVFFVGNPVQKGDNHSIFWPNSIKRTPCMVFLAVFVFGSTLIDTHFAESTKCSSPKVIFQLFLGTPFFSATWTPGPPYGRLGSDFPKTHSCWKQDYNAYMGESLDLGWNFDKILTIEMTWFFVFPLIFADCNSETTIKE